MEAVANKKEVSMIPKLRFKEFEGEWEITSINDLVARNILGKPLDGNHGNIHPVAADFTSTGIPFIMANCFKDGKIYIEDAVCIPQKLADNLQKGFAIQDDVLLTHKGSVGLTAIVPEIETDYIMLTPQVTYYRVIDKSLLINTFLKVVFETSSFQRRLKTLADSGTRPYIGITLQRTLETPLPTLPEQQKIASFLSAVDEKIQQLTRKKTLLEQYKKGVMQQLFAQQIRFKDDEGNDYPDWELVGGNELFDNISDKKHNSDLPILAITQDQGAIPRDMIDYQMTVTEKSIASYKVVQVGDFVISLRTFQGGIEYSSYHGICSPAYIILRPSFDRVDRSFYKFYLKTSFYIKQLQKNLEGIRDGKMISYKYFSEIKLPFPSINEQQKIATYLSSLDQKIESVHHQITHTQTFKKGLLQGMFV